MTTRYTLIILLLVALVLPRIAAAQVENRIDPHPPHTGRQRAIYPPPRHYEHIHMRLEIDIPDMSAPVFRARQMLTVAPVGRPRQVLVLDAAPPPAIRVLAVSSAGRALAYEQIARAELEGVPRHHSTQGVLRITFPAPIAPGLRTEIVIEYEANYPDGAGTGLTWTPGNPRGPGETDRFAQIHSQGQAQHNHTWFPCHDFPNQRLSTELIVTVEDPYIVGSNGRLVSTRLAAPTPDGSTRTTWHWLQEQPHPNYLVSLVIGRFSIVALPPPAGDPEATPRRADGRIVPCSLLVPIGSEGTAQRAFASTPAMIAFFSKRFGYPYPWDKYSQALVRQFAWGGMENTSATTLKEEYAFAEPGSEDDLIAHEIAHQWFGNLVTAKSWEHLWLNEGWASFAEALWAEHAAGPDPEQQRLAYQEAIAGFFSAQRLSNRSYAPTFPAMVSNRYEDPDETFLRADDVYAKGAVVLHMLRQKLGDEAFFAGTRLYLVRFAFQQVETDDFRRCMEEVSGLSLERFFEQWCYRPGLPRLDVAMEWSSDPASGGGSELTVIIEQTQRIDHDNPAYAFTFPVHIRAGGHTYIRYIEVDARTTEARFVLPDVQRRPDEIIFDPDMTVAALTRITRDLPAE
jgi:aminopeptidase N